MLLCPSLLAHTRQRSGPAQLLEALSHRPSSRAAPSEHNTHWYPWACDLGSEAMSHGHRTPRLVTHTQRPAFPGHPEDLDQQGWRTSHTGTVTQEDPSRALMQLPHERRTQPDPCFQGEGHSQRTGHKFSRITDFSWNSRGEILPSRAVCHHRQPPCPCSKL